MLRLLSAFLRASLCVCILATLSATAYGKDAPENPLARYRSHFPTPPNVLSAPIEHPSHGPALTTGVADTFHLAWYSFDSPSPDAMGWSGIDLGISAGPNNATNQYDIHWQVETFMALSGGKSRWCGRRPAAGDPYCNFATLPGYGNRWDQILCSEELAESVCVSFEIFYESEVNFDETSFQWSDDNDTWVDLGVFSADAPGVLDTLEFYAGSTTGSVWLRFRFVSDVSYSDEDGFIDTNGAVRLDNIRIREFLADGTPVDDRTSTFESVAVGDATDEHGIWTAKVPESIGSFAALHQGTDVLQEDFCGFNASAFWGFFDDPSSTNYACHTPDPRPDQGAVPNFHGEGLYLFNEIWSPRISNAGAGGRYQLLFDVYEDLPQVNQVVYVWHVRAWRNGCPGPWVDQNLIYFGDSRTWVRHRFEIPNDSDYLSGADEIQIAIGAWDVCVFHCSVLNDGSCHSHAPLLDNVHLLRINETGPQFIVRHIDLFQDTFASDGTTTGHARADCANDITPAASPNILPGDSVTVTITNVGTHPGPEGGPAAYAYISVWPPSQGGKAPLDLEAPEMRDGNKRYPYLNTITHDGVDWYCYRMDNATDINTGQVVPGVYAIDFNDWVFTPCDTICYIFCAEDSLGNRNYFTRGPRSPTCQIAGQGDDYVTDDLWLALSTPMEFTILPAAGWKRGGDILYVDGSDDRGGPAELYFDDTFLTYNLFEFVDRYDILGPAYNGNNSLASRVTNIQNQIIDCYRVIIWSTGSLRTGLIGDGFGGNPEKSNDGKLLYDFLDLHPDNPGLYLNGNNIAEEWASVPYQNEAGLLKADYINHSLLDGDHINGGATPMSAPLLTAVGPCFIHAGWADSLIAFSGCTVGRPDFDLITPVPPAVTELHNPLTGNPYLISQTTANSNLSTARVVLSGFGLESVVSAAPGFPIGRMHHLHDILIWLQTTPDEPTGVPEDDRALANRLESNYPNPFNPVTAIHYEIKTPGRVTLRVYDVSGALVRTLVNELKSPLEGGFTVEWNGRDNSGVEVASGVYFYRMTAKGFEETKKMVLLK